MTMEILKTDAGAPGANLNALRKAVVELQGLNVTIIGTGAAANTKMNIAAMRPEDTILAVQAQVTASGVTTDDTANCTIDPVKATGTVTLSTVLAATTVVVNGTTYTFAAGAAATLGTPYTTVFLGTTDTTAAANLRDAINAQERIGGRQPVVVATAAVGVVTLTAVEEGTGGNAITLTKTGASIAVSGATLTGGTATGGFKSTTNLSASNVMVFWFNKK